MCRLTVRVAQREEERADRDWFLPGLLCHISFCCLTENDSTFQFDFTAPDITSGFRPGRSNVHSLHSCNCRSSSQLPAEKIRQSLESISDFHRPLHPIMVYSWHIPRGYAGHHEANLISGAKGYLKCPSLSTPPLSDPLSRCLLRR